MNDEKMSEHDCNYDFDTLMRGEEIRSNPKRLAAAIDVGKGKEKAIKSITGLRKAAMDKVNEIAAEPPKKLKKSKKLGNPVEPMDDDDTEEA